MKRIAWFKPKEAVGLGHEILPLSVGNAIRRAGVEVVIDTYTAGQTPDLMAYSLAIVDQDPGTFWSAYRKKRVLVPDPVWILARWFPPHLLRKQMEGVPRRFKLIATEPVVEFPYDERIDPIVYCDRSELHAKGELKRVLSGWVGPIEQRGIALLINGDPEGLSELPTEQLDSELRKVTITNKAWPWPITRYLDGADQIVSGAGYSRFWETHTLGLEQRTTMTYRVLNAGINDQFYRLRNFRPEMVSAIKGNGADKLVDWIGRL